MNDDLRDVLELVFDFGKRYGMQWYETNSLYAETKELEESKNSLALENKKLREKIERMKEANNG